MQDKKEKLPYKRMSEKGTGSLFDRLKFCSPDLICVLDQDGKFIEVSEAVQQLLGYRSSELIGQHYSTLLSEDDYPETFLFYRKLAEGREVPSFVNRYIHKTGSLVPLNWSASWSEEDNAFFCIGRKAPARDQNQQNTSRNEKLHEALIEHGSDMLGMLNEDGVYLYVGGSITKTLGYEPEDLVGKNAFSFIHPDDLEKVEALWALSSSNEMLPVSEFRFLAAGGDWLWMEANVSNQLKNPDINAVVITSRDITERKSSRLKLEETEQRFRSLFENNPDIIVFEDRDGKIIDANGALETTLGLKKQDFLHRSLEEFIFGEPNLNNLPGNSPTFKNGVVSYGLEAEFEKTGKKILDVTKVPMIINQEIAGTCTIIKDITDIAQSHKTIREQATKLNTIFESITDAFFSVDRNWKITYINSEFDRLLRTRREEVIGKSIWDFFPEEKNGIFYQHYKEALDTGTTTYFEAYLTKIGIWLEVKAFPSKEGLSVYFSDTTHRIKAQEDLKKLSTVARKSPSGVIIADKEGKVEWVNESFTQITEYSSQEVLETNSLALFKCYGNFELKIKEAVSKLSLEEFYEAELPFKSKTGKRLWINVGITPVTDQEGLPFRFIFTFTDITLQKRAVLERNRFIEELQSRNHSLRQFTHLVSHKLRAPVANILGLTSLFDLPQLDQDTKKEAIDKLGIAAGNLDEIIKDLNHILSLNESVGLKKKKVEFDVVLEEVIQMMNKHIQEAEIDIRSNFTTAPYIFTVRLWLMDILFNLLSNAITFRSPDKKAIIEVYTKQEGTYIVLVVKDNGIGFDLEKHQNQVFGLYTRFHPYIGGKGLGLYLVKTQVDALGGKVEVSSKSGWGSEFKVYFKQKE